MKISKSIQRRTVVFAALAALFTLFQVTLLLAQLAGSADTYYEEHSFHYLGQIDTAYNPFKWDDDYRKDAITVERDAEGEPLVEALPTQLMFFSKNPAFRRPDHFGWRVNLVIVYVVTALFVVIVLLVAWLLISAIQGFRTGNIFRRNHPALLRWLALATFLYFMLVDNRSVFTQFALGELYGDLSPIKVYSYASIGVEAFVAPLLLLIFAELMAIAARINEEESMTI